MSVNSPQPVAAPTAPSRAAKAALATAGEGFDVMFTNAVADTATGAGDRAPAPTTDTSADAAAPEVPDALSDADLASDETNVDAGTAGLLNGAALFVIQPQAAADAGEGSGAIDTDGSAKAGVELVQTAANEIAPAADASKAAQPSTDRATAAANVELLAAALSNDASQPSDAKLSAETAAKAEAAKESATLPASAPSTLATAQMAAPRLAASAFGTAASNAAAGSAKIDGDNGEQHAEASDTTIKSDGKTASGSSAGQAAIAQASTTQSQTAANSAFATQMQAQAQAQAAESDATSTTDTLPTGQSLPAQSAASTATAPVVTSFSSLSRATLETTVQIAAQITRQLAGRSTRFEMGLTPEGLGKVNVSMDIDADGQLTARLAFDNPLAAADLRARADELRTQLQDAGFKLADDALTFSQQDASTFSDGGAADQHSDRSQNRAFASASRMAADADAIPVVPAWVSLSLTPRGVDLKV